MNQFYSNNELLPKLELDENRRRVKQCPCGESNRDEKFAPYIGYEDKGYCHSCGVTFLPELPEQADCAKPGPRPKPTSFIEEGTLESTLSRYGNNNLSVYLKSLFGEEVTSRLLKKYCVGTSKKWNGAGATIFWQKDIQNKVRTGKIMLYSPTTGKRIKEPPYFSFVNYELKLPEFNLNQCFFGEHLLKDDDKPVAIAESEKTAIIASYYLPQFTWLACGGSDGLTNEKCEVLAGRNICLYPDLSKADAKVSCYESWCRKAEELNRLLPNSFFQVSPLLENNATEEERNQGLGLADFLIRLKTGHFHRPEPAATLGPVIPNATEYVVAPVPDPLPIWNGKQAAFDRLKEKYPVIRVLAERLDLEVLS